ncbi:MAG: uracil-DNA glycosylase family protein [Galbibacter orientalis]|uniref:uracil-DNA glycosylase family protein n=1 Tax=Galbibacter orientalis TaxID=453852 RepID=UPI0030020E78
MQKLLQEISQCQVCAEYLPLEPRPVLRVTKKSKILIIGQAPGLKVHTSGIDWDDQSGKKLRTWLGVDNYTFYNSDNFGILPMGFCYPGKAKSGDLPPRPECKPQWHDKVVKQLESVELTILVGQYAQKSYLKDRFEKNLTETVRKYNEFLPEFLPIPHPSPTNRFWIAKNKWFETDVIPILQQKVKEILK